MNYSKLVVYWFQVNSLNMFLDISFNFDQGI